MKVELMQRKLLIILFLLPLLAACSERDGQLKPLRPSGDGDLLLAAQPQLVTFSELQDDPEAFQDFPKTTVVTHLDETRAARQPDLAFLPEEN